MEAQSNIILQNTFLYSPPCYQFSTADILDSWLLGTALFPRFRVRLSVPVKIMTSLALCSLVLDLLILAGPFRSNTTGFSAGKQRHRADKQLKVHPTEPFIEYVSSCSVQSDIFAYPRATFLRKGIITQSLSPRQISLY